MSTEPSQTPPGRVQLNLQADTDRALSVLLAELGLTVLGPNGATSAKGVTSMHLGRASLDGGSVPIAGRFAFVFVDREQFGPDETDALVLAAEAHRWKGEPLAYLMGEEALYNPESHVPQSVTMRQARLALLAVGKLSAVEAAMDALPEPTKTAAKITWEYSQEVQRHNGLVPQMAAALGMTDEQIDALFIAARTL